MRQTETLELAMRTSYVSLAGNVFLTAGKFIAGVLGNSMVMIADAVHSASDVLSTLVVMLAVKISGKPEDSDHEYGHERFESIGAISLALMLAAIGLGIGFNGLETLLDSEYEGAPLPSITALMAAVVSILIKEWMYRYTRRAGELCRSEALIADAWHHRSDAMSSVGSLIGIGASRLGFAFMDALASVVVCVFIIKSAAEIFMAAVNKLTDRACDAEIEESMRRTIEEIEGVLRLDVLKTRQFGSKSYVDVEISVDGDLSLRAAHEIAELVHDRIERDFEDVKHCTVHVNPID